MRIEGIKHDSRSNLDMFSTFTRSQPIMSITVAEAYHCAIQVGDDSARCAGRYFQNEEDREQAVQELRRLWPYVVEES